jgi:hypothetical protein
VTGTRGTSATASTTSSRRTRTGSSVRSRTTLLAMCLAGACAVGGCGLDTTATSPMELTVSSVTGAPMTLYFDVHERGENGQAGRAIPATRVDLSPHQPAVVLPVPYDRGYWLEARVAGPPDRPVGTSVGCELRASDGRVLAVDATDPFGPPTEDAGCSGSG